MTTRAATTRAATTPAATTRAATARPAAQEPRQPPKPAVPVPEADRAERALLGAVLLDPRVLDQVRGLVRPGDFRSPRRAAAFALMLELAPAGRCEPLTLETALRQRGDHLASVVEILVWCDEAVVSCRAAAHARLVRDAARRRRLLELSEQIADQLGQQQNTDDILDHVRAVLASL